MSTDIRRTRRRCVVVQWLLLAVVVPFGSACGSDVGPTPAGSLNPGEVWVPVADWRGPDGQPLLCAGGGLVGDYRLHGSPRDARVVWMIEPNGNRTELAWPVGYRARFSPNLELVSDGGTVVGREGSLVTDGCETAQHGVMSVTLGTN